MKTVVVLAGGYSTEHQISLASGRTAEAAFVEAGLQSALRCFEEKWILVGGPIN
jgi:D-alanine-D-alanine ligase-like ATP-grasp enzyme